MAKADTAVPYVPPHDNDESILSDDATPTRASDATLKRVEAFTAGKAAAIAAELSDMGAADPLDDEYESVAHDPLVVAARSGDRRLLLEALRDRLAIALVNCNSGRDIAAMSRNLNIISRELDDIYAAENAATDAEDDNFSIENMRRYAQAVQLDDDLGVADDDEDEDEDSDT